VESRIHKAQYQSLTRPMRGALILPLQFSGSPQRGQNLHFTSFCAIAFSPHSADRISLSLSRSTHATKTPRDRTTNSKAAI
jgi:hypothetical protein